METLRIIEHGNGHTDIEALIYGEWVVVKCTYSNQGETTMYIKKIQENIEVIAERCEDENSLLDAAKIFRYDESVKWACVYLLWACESHERKA